MYYFLSGSLTEVGCCVSRIRVFTTSAKAVTVFDMIGLHVDDLPLACNGIDWLKQFKEELGQRLKVSDVGELNWLLGMHMYHQGQVEPYLDNRSV